MLQEMALVSTIASVAYSSQFLGFQHSGFTDWKNAKGSKRGALPLHEASESHKVAAMKEVAFKDICAGKLKGIQSSVSSEHEEQVKRNRLILLSIIDVVIALGRRNVPFCGHQWNKQTRRENGNFDFFLH